MDCSNVHSELLELKAVVVEIATRLDAVLESLSTEATEHGFATRSEISMAQGSPIEVKGEAIETSHNRQVQATDCQTPTSYPTSTNPSLDPNFLAVDDRVSLTPPPLPPEIVINDQDSSNDNLCLIKGVDGIAASILAICDVQSFADIACFQAEDVIKFNTLLGGSCRIQRENWIEQAAILANGGTTNFAGAYKSQDDRAHGTSDAKCDGNCSAEAIATVEPMSASQVEAQMVPFRVKLVPKELPPVARPPEVIVTNDNAVTDDDLCRIKGIDSACASILTKYKVRTFADISHLKTADVDKLNAILSDSRRIQRENWIEQATILADGRSTKFAEAYKNRHKQTRDDAAAKRERDCSPRATLDVVAGCEFQQNERSVPLPAKRTLESNVERTIAKRPPAWRSIAACLAIGLLAAPLISGEPSGAVPKAGLRGGHAWCLGMQSKVQTDCHKSALRLVRAFSD